MIKANSKYGPQGTWQFMSAKLIKEPGLEHNFVDDLESSLYVLLWVTLMYSEVSDRDQVPPFLASVLDPQPYNNKGGFAKMDFLKGRSFLQQVQFPNRPALHRLIDSLAELFRYRYETQPTKSERAESNQLRAMLDTSSSTSPLFWKAYEKSSCRLYDVWMAKLENHHATIDLFITALSDRSGWPANDFPVQQVFQPKPSNKPVLKTDWNTTLFVEALCIK